jgi:hypothetical protein
MRVKTLASSRELRPLANPLRTLRRNKGTGKLLLVNFWATWCDRVWRSLPTFTPDQQKRLSAES